MTLLAAPVLPAELRGCWVYGPGPRRPQDREKPRSPIGALLNHGDHMLLVVWAGPSATNTRLAGPALTLANVIECHTCGAHGRIVNDRWEAC